jgi:hypothetical protein
MKVASEATQARAEVPKNITKHSIPQLDLPPQDNHPVPEQDISRKLTQPE